MCAFSLQKSARQFKYTVAVICCVIATGSQLVRADSTNTVAMDLTWAERMAQTTMLDHPEAWKMRKSDGEYRWAYTQGLVLTAIETLYHKTQKRHYFDYIQAYADHYIDAEGNIATFKMDEFNIDSINAGKILFNLYSATKSKKYLNAMMLLRKQLDWHPRTSDGVFWHKLKYPWQIWLDGLYMAAPFYAQYETQLGDPHQLADVVRQFTVSEQKLRESNTGLLYHGWDESRIQQWADKDSGLSPSFWSRSLGWYAMALVDTLDYIPPDHPQRPTLINILKRLIDALIPYQHSSGLWYQVTDQIERSGNYPEASATAMFTYAIAKGVRKQYLPSDYRKYADRAFKGLTSKLMDVEVDGRLRLRQICRSAGLGGEPYRDGTFDYYIHTDIVTNDAHGVGAFILAAVEMEY